MQLGVVFAFKVGLHLRLESSLFLVEVFFDLVHEAAVADCRLDHFAVLFHRLVGERNQVLKRLECKLAEHELVVVVVVLDHAFGMQLHVRELFECRSEVFVHIVGASSHVLEPHRLVVVDAHIISAVLHKDVHDPGSFLDLPSFEGLHGTDCINSTVCHVEVASLFVQLSGFDSISSLLVNLSFQSVKF